MPEDTGKRRKAAIAFLFLVSLTLAILRLDWLSKQYFLERFIPGQTVPVIEDVLHFTLIFNKGIAFGMFQGDINFSAFISFAYALFILACLFKFCLHERLLIKMGLCMLWAGCIGNLIDRVLYGFVIDFIDLRVWPVFNIADASITLGAVIVILSIITKSIKRKPTKKEIAALMREIEADERIK
jgi:signal peptidase II